MKYYIYFNKLIISIIDSILAKINMYLKKYLINIIRKYDN